MNGVAKIAISLPADTLAQVEALRKRTGKSRSAVFTDAVKALLAHEQVDDRDRRYVEAYLRQPMRQRDSDELAAVATAVSTTWEPWT